MITQQPRGSKGCEDKGTAMRPPLGLAGRPGGQRWAWGRGPGGGGWRQKPRPGSGRAVGPIAALSLPLRPPHQAAAPTPCFSPARRALGPATGAPGGGQGLEVSRRPTLLPARPPEGRTTALAAWPPPSSRRARCAPCRRGVGKEGPGRGVCSPSPPRPPPWFTCVS